MNAVRLAHAISVADPANYTAASVEHTLSIIVHVFGAGALIGAALLAVLILRRPVTRERLEVLRTIATVMVLATLTQLLTGLHLYTQSSARFNGSGVFWAKMTIVAVGGLFGAVILERRIRAASEEAAINPKRLRGVPLWAWLVLGSALAAAALGVILSGG